MYFEMSKFEVIFAFWYILLNLCCIFFVLFTVNVVYNSNLFLDPLPPMRMYQYNISQ